MLQASIRKSSKAFCELLSEVQVSEISGYIYCQKYLSHIIDHKEYFMSIYSDVLVKMASTSSLPYTEMSIVDFGAGNGVLSIFAKHCGFGQVCINDIDEKFVEASKNLSKNLGISIDGFIHGDIHSVEEYFSKRKPLDGIIATDVIEHIYSLDDFFSTLNKINPAATGVFTTASNPLNKLKIRKLEKLQLADELRGGTPDDFLLFGDAPLEPFLTLREKIIAGHNQSLSRDTITALAKKTRGMNQQDVRLAVDKFVQHNQLPVEISHPTNTCNPINSSWTERILSLEEYEGVFKAHGFTFILYKGFYDSHKKGLKWLRNYILNAAVRIFGLYFAPYIIFVSKKK